MRSRGAARREQRPRKEQRQVEQRQQQNSGPVGWQQHDDRTYECIRLWIEQHLADYLDIWSEHEFENGWKDVGSQIIAEERANTREQIADETKKMQGRSNELETLVWTQWHTNEKRHAEAMEQVAQRMTALETMVTETRSAIDDMKRELTNNVTKRIGELESVYWGQREKDEKQHAEQTRLLSDRLTAVEQQTGDLKRGLGDGHKRIGELEGAYWGQRESDQRQRNEQTKDITHSSGRSSTSRTNSKR